MLVYLEFGTALPFNGGPLIYVRTSSKPLVMAADPVCSLTRASILPGF